MADIYRKCLIKMWFSNYLDGIHRLDRADRRSGKKKAKTILRKELKKEMEDLYEKRN